MNSVLLQTPIAYLKTVGPTRAKLLKEQLGIHTYQDLLHFFPNRYVDRTQFHHINQLEASQAEVQIVGVITQIETITQKKGSRLVAKFLDNTGAMELVWFKGAKWIKESIKTNTPYVIFGKISVFQGRFNPDQTTKTAKSNLGNGSLSPLNSTLPPICPSPASSQPTFLSVASKPPPPPSSKPCASTIRDYFFGPKTSKINFSPLQSESTGEHFVIPPNKVRLENTNDKSKWQMPTLSKPMLIVGDSVLSSINSIR